MKRLLWLLWFGMSVAVNAQTSPPIWVHDVYRRINYPPEQWHTGFVQDRLKTNENASTMLKTIELDAINKLAESIIVTVESETQVVNVNRQQGGRQQGRNDASESGGANISQKVKTVTSATLINLDINSYYDPSTEMLYAFAAIKRSDLAAYFLNQLNTETGKAETAIKALRQLIMAGRKSSARNKIKEVQGFLDDIRLYRTILDVTNPEMIDKNAQPGREDELQRTFEQLLFNFDPNIIVYINCQWEQKGAGNDAFKSNPSILCDIIRQALNENECIITNDISKADFELKLIASNTLRSDGNDPYGILSYYANVKASLYDRTEQKQLVDFTVLNDPNVYAAGRSPEDAATKAFKLPALRDMIMEKILPAIQD